MKETFSSRDFEAKVDRSKKFRVEIGNDEKNAWVGIVVGVGRPLGLRVMSELRSAAAEPPINNSRQPTEIESYLADHDQDDPYRSEVCPHFLEAVPNYLGS